MKTKTRCGINPLCAVWMSVLALAARPTVGALTLVEEGVSRAPVVIFENPPLTLRAAQALTDYIEKIGGVRPELIEGTPTPLPDTAIWVGYQPVLDDLFPDLDFDFENPERDGHEILVDYYRRAFGPASETMQAYWRYLEALREACYGEAKPGQSDHDVVEFYNDERLDPAFALLAKADEIAADGPDIYRRRIEFVKAGLECTRLLSECGRLMKHVNAGADPDGSKRENVLAKWEALRRLQQAHPSAMRWRNIFGGWDGTGPPALRRAFYPRDP